MTESPTHFAIIGGGITGLSAAYDALARGEKNVHIYEASGRCGGKILSGELNGTPVNRGAEFIDSDNTQLIALCQKMGVRLEENTGMETEIFQRPNGSLMDAESFYRAYQPYAQQVMYDRAELEANPHSPRAQHLRQLNLRDYLSELGANLPPAPRSIWQWLKDTVLLRGNESPTTLAIAANAYASEAGQPPQNISATQFIAETSATLDSFLASDCKFRVAGGTQQLIEKLRAHLTAQGVQFHENRTLTHVGKTPEGRLTLGFAGDAGVATCDRALLAMPAYAFAQVQGLEALGLSPASIAALQQLQYTNSIKCTVSFQPGMETPDAAFFANGYQTWSPSPGQLTFLANADALTNGQSPKAFLGGLMESYAKAHGSTAAKMFDVSKLLFTNPGKSACYATPKPEQVAALDALKAELPTLAQHGVGIAGTFLPHKGGYGFMECGIISAQQACALLASREKSVARELHLTVPAKQWVPEVIARREAANDLNLCP